jgi:hypothetical protein
MATIITRAGKGSPLENAEVDDNFTNLNTDKLEKSGGTMTGDLSFGDNDKAIFGAGSDLQIYHDGSGSYVDDQGTGGLILRGTNLFLRSSTDENYIGCIADGTVTLYYDQNPKLATTSTGIDVTGTVTADGLTVDGDITLSDTSPTISFVDTNADDFQIYANSNTFSIFSTTNNGFCARFASGGDISFYEATGTTPKFFWDASAETLNLNNTGTVYGTQLNVKSTATTNTFTSSLASGSGNPRWQFGAGVGSDSGSSTNDKVVRSGLYFDSGYVAGMTYLRGGSATTGYLAFDTDQTERMRIDSSGNLLVGKTSASTLTVGVEARPDGTFAAVKSGGASVFGRNTSDGDILGFRKDGTTVGSIGTYDAGYLYIASTRTTDAGIKLGTSHVSPSTTTGADRDNGIDLGKSTVRWKDLYLSGGVYLGGTGSANYLDDYEEGTWTAVLKGATSDPTVSSYTVRHGYYIKVGQLVWVSFYIYCNGTVSGGAGSIRIGGIPFTIKNSSLSGYQSIQIGYANVSGSAVYPDTTNGTHSNPRWQANNSDVIQLYGVNRDNWGSTYELSGSGVLFVA